MNISPNDLGAQYDRAARDWPFIDDVERANGLPTMLLFAVGSRETNLQNIVGDYGHGYGIWQRDNRSHNVGQVYLNNVYQQCTDAATLLLGNFHRFGNWQGACAAYNSGQPNDAYTTGHDYGADVMQRMAWLQKNRSSAPVNPQPRLLKLENPFMKGNDVKFWQAALWAKGMVPYPALAGNKYKSPQQWADGIFGHDMDTAVRFAQAMVHTPVDGVIGPQTIRAWSLWRK